MYDLQEVIISIKRTILEQLMTFKKEFYNEKEGCRERSYVLTEADWLKQQNETLDE